MRLRILECALYIEREKKILKNKLLDYPNAVAGAVAGRARSPSKSFN